MHPESVIRLLGPFLLLSDLNVSLCRITITKIVIFYFVIYRVTYFSNKFSEAVSVQAGHRNHGTAHTGSTL